MNKNKKGRKEEKNTITICSPLKVAIKIYKQYYFSYSYDTSVTLTSYGIRTNSYIITVHSETTLSWNNSFQPKATFVVKMREFTSLHVKD